MILTALMLCCSPAVPPPEMTDLELLGTAYNHVHHVNLSIRLVDEALSDELSCATDSLLEMVRRTIDRGTDQETGESDRRISEFAIRPAIQPTH